MIDRFWGLLAEIDLLVSLGAEVALKATVLCLAAFAADRLLGRRLLARSALWHGCLLGLLLLIPATACLPQWSVACLPGDKARIGLSDPSVTGRSITTSRDEASFMSQVQAVEPRSFAERKTTLAEPAATTSAETPPIDGRRWSLIAVASVYLAGVGLLLVRLLGSWRRATGLVRSSAAVTDADWNRALDEERRRLGVAHRVELRSSAEIGVPLFVGWRRPTILLPESLARSANRATMRAALLHELAHARRGDYAWNLLLRLAQAIYWPHPLVWLAGKTIARLREEACDRVCLFWLGDAAAYRETLVELATGLVRRPVASLGMAITRSTRLERRLAQLECGAALPRCLLNWPVRAGLACLILFCAGALATLHLERLAVAFGEEPSAKKPAADRPADPTKPESDSQPDNKTKAEEKPKGENDIDRTEATEAKRPATTDEQPVKVRVAKVKREDFVVQTAQPCELVPWRTVQLYSRASGVITRRNVELGDRVKKGDVLAEIDAPEIAEEVLIAQAEADEAEATNFQAKASVEVAEANIAEAKAMIDQNSAEREASESKVKYRVKALERMKKLVEERSVESTAVDEQEEQVNAAQSELRSVVSSRKAAEANLSRAAAQYEAAKANLHVAKLRAAAAQRHLERIRQHTEYLQIRAPIDGAIAEISANVGLVTAGSGKGEPLFVVSGIDLLKAVANVPERDALRIKAGDAATVRFDALPDRPITAKVSRMAYAIDPGTRTLRTEIDLSNPEGLLRPGMFGAVAIPLETRRNVLTIRRSAFVRSQNGGNLVYRVVEGRVAETPVRLRGGGGDAYEVLEGLAESDIVITKFMGKWRNGLPVEIVEDDDAP
ncbi:MAG TPA: efflux RND transporter periplasmic adaptor subunit [Pirellulales bacterium]|nr:efflux RND transporter periplasmic adaptor subunit [Pirellulales bacterium]